MIERKGLWVAACIWMASYVPLAAGQDAEHTHYSPLSKVTAANVRTLGLAWEYDQIQNRGSVQRGLEATPLIVDGVMYVSGPWSIVYALDARTGRELWVFDPKVEGAWARKACCDVVNRGVAVAKGNVYVGTVDGYLVALDARDGRVKWKVDTLTDRSRAYVINGAPAVAGDNVVIGNAGADMGVRGYVSAFNIETGKLAWRFYTVPGDPAKGFEHPELAAAAKTWDPRSRWEFGGGGTAWDSIVYDPELELVYVGTGNASPHPQWTRSPAGGDNLYLASILAIHARTGRLAWHYQTTPGESWDYTATQNMILAELTIDGARRRVLMQAPKNGFFYVLDRVSGELLSAEKFTTVTWAERIDMATGRPVLTKQADYSKTPKLIYPANWGGHNWQPMAFSATTGLVYIPVLEGGVVFEREPAATFKVNTYNAAAQERLPEPAEARDQPADPIRTVLKAWDPATQRLVWQAPQENFYNGGVLATGSGLVFQGTASGELLAYDDRTGALLASIPTGTGIMAAPSSYEIDGEQYIAVAAGFGGAVLGGYVPGAAALTYENRGRILVFELGGEAVPLPERRVQLPLQPLPPSIDTSAATIEQGRALFRQHCGVCHAEQGGGGYPDLWNLPAPKHVIFDQIVLQGLLSGNGMASFADVLNAHQVKAIHSFLIEDARALRRIKKSDDVPVTPRTH